MKVINLDEYSNCGGCSAMSSFEGTFSATNPAHATEFQNYANKMGANPSLVVDGKWGPKTEAAYRVYGKKFRRENDAAIAAKNATVTPVVPPVADNTAPTTDNKQKVKDAIGKGAGILGTALGFFNVSEKDASGNEVIDSATGQPKKKLNLPLVIGLSVGGLAIVGTIIYFATKEK